MSANFRRILCATDFSEFSRPALEHAAALARWSGATLAVIHVVAPPDFRLIGATPLDAAERERGLEALRRFVEPVTRSSAVRPVLRKGQAAVEIAAESLAWAADLVVVGTHGRQGLEHWELGSVAEQVIRTAPCPVLTVPRRSRPPLPAGEAPFRRVLCALDLGSSSAPTLEYALSLALRAGAATAVLHTMGDVPEDTHRRPPRLGVPLFAAYRETVEKEARARLRELLPDEVRTACAVEEIVVAGKARRQIVRVAAEREADLVVMGAHGSRPVPLAWFGSTTTRVVRQASCPVLTVRPRAAARVALPLERRVPATVVR
ncbi:MAG TPA: universal stress protein [Vicinamibacteria bacterium]|nr:universal stress protein [Vicinamibacteria bacterium]